MRNIVLIGLMGCGKSTLGAYAAQQTSYKFVDMDNLIEGKTSMTISEMFEKYGEEYFRDRESEMAKELSAESGLIIATGGGVVLREENVRALSSTGIIVFLDRPLENILSDVDVADRPLLAEGPEKLRKIYKDRYEIYTGCAHKVIINNSTMDAAARQLMELIEIQLCANFAVIGDPIEHSKSPEIHLPVLRKYLDNALYDKIAVKRGELEQHLDHLRTLRGFNLTMPHKRDIIPYLKSISSEAELCGSVNTVVCYKGEMTGHTTDGAGFFSSLRGAGIEYEGAHIVFLGAGGAARALIYHACMNFSVKIGIAARDAAKASSLRGEVMGKLPKSDIYTMPMEGEEFIAGISKADVLINATPKGMDGVDSRWGNLDFLQTLREGSAVCDLIYAPAETELLKRAKQLGLNTINGMPMLIHQAIIADMIFLNMELDADEIYKEVAKAVNI